MVFMANVSTSKRGIIDEALFCSKDKIAMTVTDYIYFGA